MLHARMFTETAKFRDHHFQPTRQSLDKVPSASQTSAASGSKLFLDGNPKFDRPLTVQFCANDPDEFLQAARYVEPFCDAVDLNLGCPQGIARKGHYGAFLQEDQDLIYRLINRLHKDLSIPVTAKMRILETKEKTLDYAKVLLSAGASIITVHGRQRDQKGHKTGLADWSVIRYLRENLPLDTVIFANGNILRHSDIHDCLEATGADAVMSAEGNLYDPSIFAAAPPAGTTPREFWRGRDGKGGWRMDAVMRRYLDIIHTYVLEQKTPDRKPLFLPSDPVPAPTDAASESSEDRDGQPPTKKQKRDQKRERAQKETSPNLLSMQAHLFHLLRPLVSKHTNVRDALARCRAGDIAAFENVLTLVEAATKEGLLAYQAHPEAFEADDEPVLPVKQQNGNAPVPLDESSVETVRLVRRPWWVVQPYVRPLPKEALLKGSLTLSKKEKARLGVGEQEGDRAALEQSAKGKAAGEAGVEEGKARGAPLGRLSAVDKGMSGPVLGSEKEGPLEAKLFA